MPERPTDIELPGWKGTLKRAVAEFRADDMPTIAAGLTYYAILSIFPALIAFIALIGVFGEYPKTSDAVLQVVGDLGPKSAVATLRNTIEDVVRNSGGAGALLGVGLLGSIWSASGYIGAFTKASNTIYEVEEGRPFLKLKPVQLGLTLLFLVVSALAAVVFVASGSLARSIFDVIGLGGTAVDVWAYAKFPVLGLIVVGMIAVLYWAAPNVEQPRFRLVSPGGAVGLLAMIAASVLFAFYVTTFASYGKTYGALATIPIALTWVWILNLALLFGAEVDAELARRKRIEEGMRPVDKEPFLPLRAEPDPPKDGAALVREELAEERDKEREARA